MVSKNASYAEPSPTLIVALNRWRPAAGYLVRIAPSGRRGHQHVPRELSYPRLSPGKCGVHNVSSSLYRADQVSPNESFGVYTTFHHLVRPGWPCISHRKEGCCSGPPRGTTAPRHSPLDEHADSTGVRLLQGRPNGAQLFCGGTYCGRKIAARISSYCRTLPPISTCSTREDGSRTLLDNREECLGGGVARSSFEHRCSMIDCGFWYC